MCICFRCKRECSRLFINAQIYIQMFMNNNMYCIQRGYKCAEYMLAYAKKLNSLFNDKKKLNQILAFFYLFIFIQEKVNKN